VQSGYQKLLANVSDSDSQIKLVNLGEDMASRRRIVRQKETYRFSATQTISDHPLLIGELLRRGELRVIHEARFRVWISEIVTALGLRMRRRVGSGGEAPALGDDGQALGDDPAVAGTDPALRDSR
jgi:hypothetical protein